MVEWRREVQDQYNRDADELFKSLEIERLKTRVAILEAACSYIADYHIPDQPMHYHGDDLSWAHRQHAHLRAIARDALKSTTPEET